jgi:ABC-type proline/glycine betaine transport system substrate-binding protein
MSNVELVTKALEALGCTVTITQEDDGSGYTVLDVIPTGDAPAFTVSVDT